MFFEKKSEILSGCQTLWIQFVRSDLGPIACKCYQQRAQVLTVEDLTFACWVLFYAINRLLFFFKLCFSNNSIRNTFKVSNTLDPDQAQQFVVSDLSAIACK